MGKNITEYSRTLDRTHVGGAVHLEQDQPRVLNLGGRVFVEGSQYISKEAGQFGQDLIDYLQDSPEDLANTDWSTTTEQTESWGAVRLLAPKAKNFHWKEEVVLGNYTYIPTSNSVDFGNARYLSYFRIDGTNKTVTRHNITYVGANTPADTSQTYAGFLMISTGTKLLAYFRTVGGWDCHTSTDGLTWIDETSSFSLATTLYDQSIYTQCQQRANRNCFSGVISQSAIKYHSVFSCGSSFIWIGYDATTWKVYNSADGLSWTDITSTIYPSGTGVATDNYYYNVGVDTSQNKAFIIGRNTTKNESIGGYTTDGGATWSSSTVPLNNTAMSEQLVKNPLDSNKFLTCPSADSADIVVTSNFGATWTQKTGTEGIAKTYGVAYFGNYIYTKSTLSENYIRFSSDDGTTWDYLNKSADGGQYIMTDKSRVIFMSARYMQYSTDNITFNETYMISTSLGKQGCVGIDANTTIFSNNDDDTFTYTTDGCVTFKTTMKYGESAMNFLLNNGVTTPEIGYLENAKMIGNVKTDNNSDDNSIFFVDRILNPNWVNTPTGGTNVDDKTRIYFRTK